MISFILTLIFVSGVTVESKTKLDDVVPICNLNDVHVDDCLKTSSQNILPTLAKGVKDWHLIGLDPITVPTIIIGQETGPVNMRWEHTNTTITGFGSAKFTGATVSKKGDAYDFAFNISIDQIFLGGRYKARGRILFFPLKNEGYQEIHCGLSTFRITIEAKPEARNHAEYLKILKFVANFSLSKDIKVFVKSDSKKPTSMDQILSRFLTDHAAELVDEMKPTFEAAFGGIMKGYIQTFFEKVPVKELFKQ